MNGPPTPPDTAGGDTVDRLGASMSEALRTLFGDSSTGATFSAAHPVGEDVIITAAAWERAGGFGFGGGDGTDGRGQTGAGGGGGGGGASVARPVAVIRIGADGVTVKPVIDVTKLAVTVVLSALGVWKVLRR